MTNTGLWMMINTLFCLLQSCQVYRSTYRGLSVPCAARLHCVCDRPLQHGAERGEATL